jgi:hypothetical protein
MIWVIATLIFVVLLVQLFTLLVALELREPIAIMRRIQAQQFHRGEIERKFGSCPP